ncbi:hypothetical protein [Streptomyces avermitilis]|uniref:hypothetical protein n=1 Tax=Streptomyces avermitilis TaxID=33903 RepID=UPI0033B6E81B
MPPSAPRARLPAPGSPRPALDILAGLIEDFPRARRILGRALYALQTRSARSAALKIPGPGKPV